MDDVSTLTPAVKGWILIAAGIVIVTWFALMWARHVTLRLDPSQPGTWEDQQEDLRLRRAMHAAGGASVESEIMDELNGPIP